MSRKQTVSKTELNPYLIFINQLLLVTLFFDIIIPVIYIFILVQNGQDPLKSVRQQGDADSHARPGRRREDDNPLQVETWTVREHNPHRGIQRRNRHLQKRQI